MLVSRSAELAALDRLLEDLRAGGGSAIVLRGPPGIGKTALLDALAQRAADVTVRRAQGVQGEAEIAFAALADLLGPLRERLVELPAPQSAALAAALALGPPAPGDRLAVSVATLGLLRAARPVLALVDDVQWLDAPSRECVLYAARRAGDGVAVALGARDPVEPALDALGLPELAPRPLARAPARTLLSSDLAPATAEAVLDAAAGNPLALVELPATLSARQRAGEEPLALPLAPGGRLRDAFAGRLRELEPPARLALAIAAAEADDDLASIAAACRAAGTDADRLEAAEARGLLTLGERELAFAHPLVRAAAYHEAGPDDRRRAHRALASVLAGDRRAWHLAGAAIGPDETAAAALEQAGRGAAERRGFGAAAAAFERAARLSAAPPDAARRLLAAGQAASAAGDAPQALALLSEASAAADGEARVRAEHLRGRVLVWTGSPGEAAAMLEAAGERAERSDPSLAAAIFADAANGASNVNAYIRAEALARHAHALDPAAPSVVALLGWILLLRGAVAEARPLLAQARRLAAGVDELGPNWPWLHLLLRARIPLGEFEAGNAEAAALAVRAREAGALATLGGALLVGADMRFRLGYWVAARQLADEAVRVTADAGQPAWQGFALSTRARLAAAGGDEARCREDVAGALAIAEGEGIASGLRFVHAALGFLELSLGRAPEALAWLERVEAEIAGSGLEDATIVPWAPDLVEAYARDGRTEDARGAMERLERQAQRCGLDAPLAAAARCRGMVEDDFDPAFAEALAADERRPLPFERARTLLALGRRLHRVRRRAEARDVLREALASFERLGAEPWCAHVRDELRAAGARRRPPREPELTAQERRVAAAVCRGASNREIAAELFLAPKTIEFHLTQIYRKLGVRSRAQLAARFSHNVPE